MSAPRERHHVIVVGAGFGGLAVAKGLRDAPVDVTIIDARNHHTFQPLLYQVATAGLDADDMCYATRGIFHKQRNARVRRGTVVAVDKVRQVVELRDGTTHDYDDLVLACGALTDTFGVPGVDEFAFFLKSAADALALRTHVIECFETADLEPGLIADGLLTFVIAGGGPTGVELAGGLAELIDQVMSRDYPHLNTAVARVVLVEANDRLLGSFAPALSAKAIRSLRAKGVEVELGVAIDKVTTDSVLLNNGVSIDALTTIWAAGVKAHPLAETLNVALERTRVVVGSDLTVPGHPSLHVIGDMATSPTADGTPLPQVAPVALQGGAYVANHIKARLAGEDPNDQDDRNDFAYRDRGSMATIGRNSAVAELPGGIRLSGFIGWVAWLVLHLVMLIGFRNRANVLVNWAWSYLTYDKGSRLIVDPKPDDGT